jgi:hypothetical protein
MAAKAPEFAAPRPIAEPRAQRYAWADHHARVVGVNIACGNYERALAAVESARRQDPDLQVEPLSLNVQQRHELPLAAFLDLRTANYLETRFLLTVGDLADVSAEEVRQIDGLGAKAIATLDQIFEKLDLRWHRRNDSEESARAARETAGRLKPSGRQRPPAGSRGAQAFRTAPSSPSV